MESKRRNPTLLTMFILLVGLLSQNLIIPVISTTIEDQKNYYSPDPHAGSSPTGLSNSLCSHSHHHGCPPSSHGSPSHGGGGSYNPTPSTPPGGGSYDPTPSPPSGGGGSYNPTPSTPPGGGSYDPTPSPPSGGGGSYNPTPSTPPGGGSYDPTPSPPSGGGGSYNPTPSTPSGGNCGTPPHEPSIPTPSTPTPSTPTTPSNPPSGGGGYYNSPPPTYGGGSPSTPITVSPPSTPITVSPPSTPITVSPPSIPIDPGTPTIPSPPFLPSPSPFTGTCNYWGTHPGIIWGLLGWWGTLGNTFGVSNMPGFGASLSLPQALSNSRTDGLGALYREGTASFLNSLVNNRFPYTTQQVRDRFVASLSSNKAAAAQANLFRMANEGRMKPRA